MISWACSHDFFFTLHSSTLNALRTSELDNSWKKGDRHHQWCRPLQECLLWHHHGWKSVGTCEMAFTCSMVAGWPPPNEAKTLHCSLWHRKRTPDPPKLVRALPSRPSTLRVLHWSGTATQTRARYTAGGIVRKYEGPTWILVQPVRYRRSSSATAKDIDWDGRMVGHPNQSTRCCCN